MKKEIEIDNLEKQKWLALNWPIKTPHFYVVIFSSDTTV